jgi:hypothetical protein
MADSLMMPFYSGKKLTGEYGIVIGAVKECLKIRNQFAHCHWAYQSTKFDAGLFFSDPTDTVSSARLKFFYRHVDVPLLEEQLAYFDYAFMGLLYLRSEYKSRMSNGKPHPMPKPKARKPPKRYNSPEKHIPPWLNEVQRDEHLERARKLKSRVKK